MNLIKNICIKSFGLCPYIDIWNKMIEFTKKRTLDTPDEIWCLEHYPVFTLGQAGDTKHILNPGNISIVHSDRGGQVTYHGPGQLIIYLLIDLKRNNLTIKKTITALQNSVINLLADFNIKALGNIAQPGVYVEDAKICSIGLKVHKNCLYHGLSLNVDMNLEPFTRINPCGQKDLKITQLRDLGIKQNVQTIAEILISKLHNELILFK